MGFSFRSTSLIVKVIVATSLVLVLAISFNVYLNTALHEGSLEKVTQEKTKIISEFIEKNVIRQMERGRHFEIDRILKNYATYKGIRKIFVLRTDGTIVASIHPEDLNQKVGDINFYLERRQFTREEKRRDESGNREEEHVYYYVEPVVNKPECYQCHDKKNQIVGVLVVANSMREIDEMVYKAKIHSVLLAVITIAFLSTILGVLFLRFVERPINTLTDTMRKVENGDLNARVHLKRQDEMGRLAESLNTMIEKLQVARKEGEQHHRDLVQRADRMASIGELASGIAHEIRNPLAGIHGAIQILAEGFPEGDKRKHVTDEVQKQIFKLERLVKDLLNYAKPLPANYVPADVNELADKILAFFLTQQGTSQDFKVEKKFFSPLPRVMMDPHSMEQAFLNIIINGRKAMPGGGTFTISTHLVSWVGKDGTEVQEVQIVFEDTGTGIPAENLSRIFNPFFSTRAEGTGLGLSITKNIIEQHRGRIEVESHVDVGTKFVVILPVNEEA